MTTAAAAPSDICEALPAVMVPLTWNAGFNLPRASMAAVTPDTFVFVEDHFASLLSSLLVKFFESHR